MQDLEKFPLISCIMPTANRPELLKLAIDSFLSQTYENKELLILDDGKSPSLDKDYCKDKENIKYSYEGPIRKAIPKKLNILSERASGEIIARFDDDDYSAPERLFTQYKVIQQGASFTGFHCILFYHILSQKVYKYFSSKNYACGTSFMFTKAFWEDNPFDELKILGEDNNLLDRTRYTKDSIVAINGEKLIVARVHPKSSVTKELTVAGGFIEQPFSVLPQDFIELLNKESLA